MTVADGTMFTYEMPDTGHAGDRLYELQNQNGVVNNIATSTRSHNRLLDRSRYFDCEDRTSRSRTDCLRGVAERQSSCGRATRHHRGQLARLCDRTVTGKYAMVIDSSDLVRYTVNECFQSQVRIPITSDWTVSIKLAIGEEKLYRSCD
jgi:hypothetical protein